MFRLDFERVEARAQADYDRLIETALKLLPGSDALVISDYAKGAITPEVCRALIPAARKLGIPVLVDPKNQDYSHYRGATTICPNLSELARALRLDPENLDALLSDAESLVSALDIEFLTATLSEKGIAVVRPGKLIAPAQARTGIRRLRRWRHRHRRGCDCVSPRACYRRRRLSSPILLPVSWSRKSAPSLSKNMNCSQH